MNPEEKSLAESIRSGAYFEGARAWFQTLYMGPISERTFFLIVAVFCGIIALICMISLASLMPITERRPVFVNSGPRAEDTTMKLVPIKSGKQDLNVALVKFFVSHYVKQRESYFASTYLSSAQFVRQHSVDEVYAKYTAQNDVTNANSNAARLGVYGQRYVTVRSVSVDDDSATVKFFTKEAGSDNEDKTYWTARIKFSYTEMKVSEARDPKTGNVELLTTDPKFQVLSYELEQK